MIILLPNRDFGLIGPFCVRSFKSVEALWTLVADGRLRIRIAELDRHIFRDIDLQNLFEASALFEEGMIKPEMVGSNGIANCPACIDFQKVPHRQGFDRYVLLALVSVHRSLTANGGVKLLNIGGGSFDNTAVRFANSSVENLK